MYSVYVYLEKGRCLNSENCDFCSYEHKPLSIRQMSYSLNTVEILGCFGFVTEDIRNTLTRGLYLIFLVFNIVKQSDMGNVERYCSEV